jgi:hypothetical protein
MSTLIEGGTDASMREQRFDALFRLDDIGAGLFVDQQ